MADAVQHGIIGGGYNQISHDILMNRFQYILPLAITRVRKPPPPSAGGDVSEVQDRKKPRKAEQVRNDAVPAEWKLRQGERWDTVFRNKSGEAPQLSCGGKLCLKFWVKGICYDDCKNKSTHQDELSEEDKSLAVAYISELRGE